MATFDLPPQAGVDRDNAILGHAAHGDLEVEWVPLYVADRLELLVTADAVKLAGVRINVSATLQQQLADLFGALLLTPKLADLVYAARGLSIPPAPMPITSSTAGMQQESAKIDTLVAAAGGRDRGAILGTVGKHWCITNTLLTHAGKACNYGWFLPAGTPSPWGGIAIYPSVTLDALVIQQPSWAHDASHVDYSQQCSLVHRSCKLDGVEADLATVFQDPTSAGLVSHEGPLQLLRQPGVALYSCPLPSHARAMHAAPMPAASGSICPTPPPPEVTQPAPPAAPAWGYVAAAAAAEISTVGLFKLAIKYAGRHS